MFSWFQHIEFAYPKMLSLFALLPALCWWYVKKNSSVQAAIKVSTIQTFSSPSSKNYFRHVLFIFRLLALCCVIIVLAKPRTRNDEQLTKGEGIDIVLSIDVSGSMLSKDFQPNRLEAAKQVAEDFIRNRPVDRIGLVIFSGESFTMCPLTTDKNTLLEQVKSLRSGMLQDGTLIGEGLATAVDRLSKSNAKTRLVILLTDGREEAPETRLIDPLTALEITKSRGVKVYTIGMSAQSTATVSEKVNVIQNNEGRKNKVIRSADNAIDEELLRRIANETGGEYFRARDKLSLENIYEQIDKLEKSKIEIQSIKRYDEKFVPFLLAALALLFIEFILRSTILKKFP